MHRVLRNVRTEYEERRVGDQEIERDVDHEYPDPCLLDEGAPAFAQLLQEARARPGDRFDVEPREEKRARGVGSGVDEQRRAWADQRDDRAADRGTERERGVARDREEPVRLLELALWDDLPHEAVGRGRVERDGRTAAALERDQLPHVGVAGDEEHAHRRAHGRARDVGADHDDASRNPVADDAAEREHRRLRQRPRREAEADRRRAAAVVEDRERHRDRGEVRPDVRDRTRREQQPERGEAERTCHGRMVTVYGSADKRVARFSAQRASPA